MTARRALGSIVILSVFALPLFAGGKGDIQKYFNDAATRAKATANPAEKRQILDESFDRMFTALDIAQTLPFISKDDSIGIVRFKATLKEKQDELAGRNGYVRVADTQLNAFSNYVVQGMEQADEVITISLVTLVLIILLIVLLL
ncbi:MAG TPA: hypothetical protein VF514_05710 [Bacteroidota bacterium]